MKQNYLKQKSRGTCKIKQAINFNTDGSRGSKECTYCGYEVCLKSQQLMILMHVLTFYLPEIFYEDKMN